MYEIYIRPTIGEIIVYMNKNLIKKENIVNLYHDGKNHILVYTSERNHY